MVRPIAIAMIVGVSLSAGTIRAQEPDDPARLTFEAGRAHFDAGRFDEAAVDFARAYELSGRPALLFNLYLAHRNAGHVQEAAEALRSYLELAENVEHRAELEERLRNMERSLAGTQSAGSSGRGSPVSWVLLGLGGAMVVSGVATGVAALRVDDRLQDDFHCGADGCDAGFEPDRRRGVRLARATDALLFGGAAVAATGVVLLLVLGGDDREEAPITAGCGPKSCEVTVRVPL